MLIADFWTSLGSALWTKFYQICFVIDGTLSKLIYGVFSVFMSLAETRIFSSEIVSDLTNRSYIVISIIMLFVLAYSILRMMINPDEITKGKFSGFALVKRIIIAIFVIAFTPAIFDFSYGLQHSVLKNNVVGKVITGSNSDSITDSAGEFTVSIFTANCYLSNHYSDEAKEEYEAAKEVALASGDVTEFQTLIPYIVNQQVVYHNFISLIVNGIILYVLVTFCFDMAIRVVKLAFLQLITPIPAIMYILPGQEASLSKWIKESAKCFFEVVVRLAIMYFTVFLFLIINRKIDSGTLFESMGVPTQNGFRMFSVVVYSMTKYFVIFGLLAFMKQAPKLISDLFGIKTDKGTFNLKQRVKDSIGTVYNPARKVVDKTAGAAGGLAAGLVMYGKGKKAGVSGSPTKAALAAFNGVRNGFRGGVRKGISGAYDYEYIMQSAYAQQPDEKYDLKTGIMDSMRDNFGFLSRYDSIKRDKQLERDVYNSTRYENVRSVDSEFAPDIENINAQHKITIDAQKAAKESSDALIDAAKGTIGKVDSQNVITQGEMIQGIFEKALSDKDGDQNDYDALLKGKFGTDASGNTVKLESGIEDLARSFGYSREELLKAQKQYESVRSSMKTENKTEEQVLNSLTQNQKDSYNTWKKFDEERQKVYEAYKTRDVDLRDKKITEQQKADIEKKYNDYRMLERKEKEIQAAEVKKNKSNEAYVQTLEDLDLVAKSLGIDLIQEKDVQGNVIGIKTAQDIAKRIFDDTNGKKSFADLTQQEQESYAQIYGKSYTDFVNMMNNANNKRLNESFNAHAIDSEQATVSSGKKQDASGNEIKDANTQMAFNRVYDYGSSRILSDYLEKGMKNVNNFTATERALYEKLKQDLGNQNVGHIRLKNEVTGEYEDVAMTNFYKKVVEKQDGVGLAKLSKKLNELIETENEAIVGEKSNISKTINVFVTDENGNRVRQTQTMTAYQAEQFKKQEKEEAEAKNKETERILESMDNLVKAQQTMKEARSKAESIKNGK